jgi:DNA-binding NarL/FixJ family response regulator
MTLPTAVLADDHVILIDGLRLLIKGYAEVIATCKDGGALLETTLRLRPDLVITDISMPVLTGLEFLRRIKESGVRPRVIILSMYGDEALVTAAFRAGASGYLPKFAAGEELIHAVDTVMAGGRYVSRLLRAAMPEQGAEDSTRGATRLSPRQREVLRLVAAGRTMKEIAVALSLSPRTVEMHKYHMMRSLGVRSTAELVRYFVKHEALADVLEQPSLGL